MQLPDETVRFHYQPALHQPKPDDEWTAEAELQARHFLCPQRLRDFVSRVNEVRTQLAGERETDRLAPPQKKAEAAFLDWPEHLLQEFRKDPQGSELARIHRVAGRLREQADQVVVLGSGTAFHFAKAVFEGFASAWHNALPGDARQGRPRLLFADMGYDNDAVQDLVDALQALCVNPDVREERWAALVISGSDKPLEIASVLRVLRREASEYYGSKSPRLAQSFTAILGESNTELRALLRSSGCREDEIFVIPDRLGCRYGAFSAIGLMPAALLGLDLRALLMGAASMTRQFLDETFDRNPALQLAAVSYLLAETLNKPVRCLWNWSRKLSGLASWYAQLLAECLGRRARGVTALPAFSGSELCSRGRHLLEGSRDAFVLHLLVENPRSAPICVGMSDRNEDGLNVLSRKSFADLQNAAHKALEESLMHAARPQASLIVPTLNEHTFGQLAQLLLLATAVEARLWGLPPCCGNGNPIHRRLWQALQAPPNGPTPTAESPVVRLGPQPLKR